MKEMSNFICGKATVGGNYNSTRDSYSVKNSACFLQEKKAYEKDYKKEKESHIMDK